MPDGAIFADTQDEPEEVYKYLEYLKTQVKNIPIYICSHVGGGLCDDMLNYEKGKKGSAIHAPLYTTDKKGKSGMIKRQCTNVYKIPR